MTEIQKVRVTNMNVGISGTVMLWCVFLMVINSCTDSCKDVKNELQCLGKLSRLTVEEFNKGYKK